MECKGSMTPLHWAAANGNKEVAQLLLVSKADVNARGSSGMTPFHLAVANGKKDVADLLRQHGGQEKSYLETKQCRRTIPPQRNRR